ncbi:MAG: amino acid transporter permease [Chthoniobacteraceae bacterium]|nr:amino acid transporter permease [Chthoniobacteraceae bacterium]
MSAIVLLGAIGTAAFWMLDYHWTWGPVLKYWRLFLDGWVTTLVIASLALPLSTAIGLLLALGRRCPWMPVRDAARIWVEITRGTPLLVQIYFYFYVIGQALALNNRYIVGPLILSAFSGAYLSEIIRAGIEGVGKSQLESARAIGLGRLQIYRYVIFPQAIRQILPPMAGQFVSLIKDSSLLSVIGLSELTLASQEVSSVTLAAFESYLPVAFGYLLLTLPISLFSQWLEKKLRFET